MMSEKLQASLESASNAQISLLLRELHLIKGFTEQVVLCVVKLNNSHSLILKMHRTISSLRSTCTTQCSSIRPAVHQFPMSFSS